jgi:hypothetical protein
VQPPQAEIDPKAPEPARKPLPDICRECGTLIGYGFPEFHIGLCDECDTEDNEDDDNLSEPEPTTLRLYDGDDDEPEPDNEFPELSEEVLAKMFANMREHGLM